MLDANFIKLSSIELRSSKTQAKLYNNYYLYKPLIFNFLCSEPQLDDASTHYISGTVCTNMHVSYNIIF